MCYRYSGDPMERSVIMGRDSSEPTRSSPSVGESGAREDSVATSLAELRKIQTERFTKEAEEERQKVEEAARREAELLRKRHEEEEEQGRKAEEERRRAEATEQAQARLLDVEKRLAAREGELRHEFDLEREQIRREATHEIRMKLWRIVGLSIGVALCLVVFLGGVAYRAISEREDARGAMLQVTARALIKQQELRRQLDERAKAFERANRELGELRAKLSYVETQRAQTETRLSAKPRAKIASPRQPAPDRAPGRKGAGIQIQSTDDPLGGLSQ